MGHEVAMKTFFFILAALIILTTTIAAGSPGDTQNQEKRKSKPHTIEKKYTGKKGNFVFHEVELKTVLLFFAKTYKLNIVLDNNISGKVTCRLIKVPWDQALDLILRQHGLAMIREGSVVAAKRLQKD